MRTPTIHATCIAIEGNGVLFRGPSGVGKSRIALHFIDEAAASGRHTRLVADDRVHLEAAQGRLIASAPASIAGLIERRRQGPQAGLRDAGIEAIDHQSTAEVRLIVDIVGDDEYLTDPRHSQSSLALLGIEIRHLIVPRDFNTAIARIEAILSSL